MRSRRGSIVAIGVSLSAFALANVGGCSTEDGDTAHGPTFGDLPGRDGGPDARTDGGTLPDGAPRPTDGATSCEGTIALLGGDDGALGAAVQTNGGAWMASPLAGGAAKSTPALIAFRDGFLAATHGPSDVLQSTRFQGTWSPLVTIGAGGVKGSPALTVAGSRAHVVYAAGPGANRDYAHGIHDGTSWNAATDAVGPPLSFGTVSAGLASIDTDALFVENGSNEGLYVRTYGSVWSLPSAVFGAGTVGAALPATPEALSIQGTFDLLIVYVERETRRLSFATRRAAPPHDLAGGTNIHPDATTAEKLSLAHAGEQSVAVAFRGQDGKGYYSRGALGSTITWTAALPVGGDVAPDVDSTPVIARGICGDDAVVAYASGGTVFVTRLRGASWTTPAAVAGVSGTRVAIATR